jgi:hypothetical protein
LFSLCVNDAGFPVGFYHPEIFLDLLGGTLSPEILNELRRPYVYLSAYYFCLDSIVDGHSPEKRNALYLTHLLASATHRFSSFFLQRFPNDAGAFETTFFRRISNNSTAVLAEQLFRAFPTTPNESEERANIIGRSNSSLLLIDILSIATKTPLTHAMNSLMHDFLFYMQLGDDLGDWRIDYRASHWTSFLRKCFACLGRIAATEDELERQVYLTGIYEERAILILKGFDRIINALTGAALLRGTRFRDFVQTQRTRLHDVLVGFVIEKQPSAFDPTLDATRVP